MYLQPQNGLWYGPNSSVRKASDVNQTGIIGPGSTAKTVSTPNTTNNIVTGTAKAAIAGGIGYGAIGMYAGGKLHDMGFTHMTDGNMINRLGKGKAVSKLGLAAKGGLQNLKSGALIGGLSYLGYKGYKALTG
jgi:hypothetical protein